MRETAGRRRSREARFAALAGAAILGKRLLIMVAHGLDILRAPGPALSAASLQVLGWAFELVGVWFAFRAFQIDAPFAAAAVVLVVTNVTRLWGSRAAPPLPSLPRPSRPRPA